MTRELEAALAALIADQREAALDHLLAAWRIRPAPELAELIAEVSRRALSALAPHERELQLGYDAWRTVAIAPERRAADLARLIAALPSLTSDCIAAAFGWLAAWAPDPRLTDGLVELLERPVSLSFYFIHYITALEQNPDPRLPELLEKIDFPSIYPPSLSVDEHAAGLAKRMRAHFAVAVTLNDAERALVERIDELVHPARQSIAELLAAIYADPDDDRPRRVLGDLWLEQGEPRGELIALQFAAEPHRFADRRREAELLRSHQMEWLGPLARLLRREGLRFERGFPVAARIDPRAERHLAALTGHPAWATFRALDLGGLNHFPSKFLRHPTMRSLDAVGGLGMTAGREALEQIEPLALRSIDLDLPGRLEGPLRVDENDLRRLSETKALPSLRCLGLSGRGVAPSFFRFLWSTEIGQRLHELAVTTGALSLAAWLAETETTSGLPPSLTILSNHHGLHWKLTLTRGVDGRYSVLDARFGDGKSYNPVIDLVAALRALPKDALTRLTIALPGARRDQVTALEEAARRQTRLDHLALPPATGSAKSRS